MGQMTESQSMTIGDSEDEMTESISELPSITVQKAKKRPSAVSCSPFQFCGNLKKSRNTTK